MARDSEFQRERKKKQLRQSMVTNDKVRSAPVSWAEDHRRTVNVAGIVVAVLVLAVVLAWFVAERLWRYKTYEVSWRTDVSNASSAGYVSYGDGIVVMNKDGATYYDKKGTKVSVSYTHLDVYKRQALSAGRSLTVSGKLQQIFLAVLIQILFARPGVISDS